MPIQRFSASNVGRHMACHASANLEVAIPNWTPPDVDPTAGAKGEGTEAHEILAYAATLPPSRLRHLMQCLQFLADLTSSRRFKKIVEESVTAKWLATEPETKPDLVLYTSDEMHIVDWKWGKISVAAVDNDQLMFYLACHADKAPRAKEFSLHIVQPPANNIDTWVVTRTELNAWMIKAQKHEWSIQNGDVTFGPSDHCTFCPANPHSRGDKGRPLCPEMMQMLYPTVTVDEDAILALD